MGGEFGGEWIHVYIPLSHSAVQKKLSQYKIKSFRDLLGGPLVKTSPSSARDMGLIPSLEAKIPLALGPENPKHKEQKQYCNKFNKDLQKKKKKSIKCFLHFQALFWKSDIYQPMNQLKIPALGKPITYGSRWTVTILGKVSML